MQAFIRSRLAVAVAVTLTSIVGAVVEAVAQTGSSSQPPAASSGQAARNGSALSARVTLDVDGVPLKDALDQLVSSGAPLIYSSGLVNRATSVSCECNDVTLDGALARLTRGQGLVYRELDSGEVVILPAPPKPAMPRPELGTIMGRVTDAETAAPLVGVHVEVVGTSISQLTGDDGRYVLSNVPAGSVEVRAQLIGYGTQTRTIDVVAEGTATVDFALEVSPTMLNELVVTATGEHRRVELGHVTGRIRADSLAEIAPVTTFGDLLQGRVAGVFSMQEGGNTSQAGRIRIRGLNTLSTSPFANGPIVVVDGARVEASAGILTDGAGRSIGGYTGRLGDLDPDEIASVEVVKGPSASTLYGTDAANGVIVITTKRGQPGRTRWTIFTEQGLIDQGLDLTDAFRDAYYAFGRGTATNAPQRCMLLQVAAGACVVDSLGSFNAFTDPATRPFKTGYRSEYGLQVSGGTANGATYFLSGGYARETGPAYMPLVDQAVRRAELGERETPNWLVRPSHSELLNLRANFTTPLGASGIVTLTTGFVQNQARQPRGFGPSAQVGYRDENDGWFGALGSGRPAYTFATHGEDDVRRFMGTVTTTYGVNDWLTLRGTIGADLSNTTTSTTIRQGDRGPANPRGTRTAQDISTTLYSIDLGGTATRALSRAVNSKTSVGVQYNRRMWRSHWSGVSDLPLGGTTIAGAGSAIALSEPSLTTAVAGGYVEQIVAVRERIFLTGALRLDGASAFGQDFSAAVYPKAGVSWLVTDGSGATLPGLSSLRLRGAYGASGVQPGPTDALARVVVSSGLNVAGTGASPGAELVAGNPDLRPERTTELEAGFDLELWASRIRLEATAYQRTTTDALVSRPNGPDVGGSRFENLGSVRNRGLELLVSAELLRGERLAAGFTAMGVLNENELLRLGEGVTLRNPTSELTQHEVGYPLYGQWGFQLESFGDDNGNGIIERDEVVLSPFSEYLGPSFPPREVTLSPYLKLMDERIRLSGLLQYRGGFYRVGHNMYRGCFSSVSGSCRAVNDPSTPLAEQARTVALTEHFRAGPYAEDGSYLLLRELSLAVTAPAQAARVVGARAAQLTLGGRNVALLWKASDLPIENAGLSADSQPSIGENPGPTTYWLLRVQLTY